MSGGSSGVAIPAIGIVSRPSDGAEGLQIVGMTPIGALYDYFASGGTMSSDINNMAPINTLPKAPNVLSPAFGTAYQATDPTKPSFVSAMIDAAYSITVAGTQADTIELRIGSSSTGLSAGTGGTAVATFRASLTGIALTIGLGLGQRNQLTALLPAAWYWCIRRVSGSIATISSATDQSLG